MLRNREFWFITLTIVNFEFVYNFTLILKIVGEYIATVKIGYNTNDR